VKNKGLSFFIIGVLVGLLFATVGFTLYVRAVNLSGQSGGGKIVLKLGHGLDQSHPVHAAMLYMAERLSEKSGGTVELEIFPNAQLGSETSAIEQVQRGAMSMTKTSAAPMESFVKEMSVFSMPYLFRDSDHSWDVLLGQVGKDMLLSLEEKGMRGLCYYDAGSRSFYTTDKPVLSPDDLKEMKIRVQKSQTAMDMVEALGGSPTPIPFGELYTALQQGMVDGAENNPPSFYTTRHFEVCKHYSLDEHAMVPDILLISKIVWDKLPEHVQKWVQEAADESSIFQRELWGKKTAEDLEAAKKEGVTVYYPDKKTFAEKVQPMYDRFAGTAIGDIIKKIKETE
jgi:tripartite ATP-independent transporter DctP family solute receptor